MTTIDPSWFPGRLRELREAAGLTQPELARKAGAGEKASVSNWEQGRRVPSWTSIVALCNALGVHPNAFARPPQPETEPREPGRPAEGLPPPRKGARRQNK